MDKTWILNNSIEHVKELPQFIEGFLCENGIDPLFANTINLAVEEALVNSISYAYKEGERGEITLSAKYDSQLAEAVFELSDKGVQFNPVDAPDVDTALSLEKRQIGGLGIFLVKELMDEVSYRYSDRKNILTMKKRVK